MASNQAQAVLHFVQAGEYPEDDSVLSSPLANQTLPSLRKELQQARDEAEVCQPQRASPALANAFSISRIFALLAGK